MRGALATYIVDETKQKKVWVVLLLSGKETEEEKEEEGGKELRVSNILTF